MFTQVHTMYLDGFKIVILYQYMLGKVIKSIKKSLLCMFVTLCGYKESTLKIFNNFQFFL